MQAKLFYSSSTNGFFHSVIHGDKIPDDAVEITEDDHKYLLQAQWGGKDIVMGPNGKPTAVDRVVPHAERVASKRRERDSALASTDWLVVRHRDEMDAGLTTTLSNDKYTSLLKYRSTLRNITSDRNFPDVVISAWE